MPTRLFRTASFINQLHKKIEPDVDSPDRSVLRPLLRFIDEIRDLRSDELVTAVLTELVPARWWQKLLHNQITSLLKDELGTRPGVIVTSVRRYLRPDSEVRRHDL